VLNRWAHVSSAIETVYLRASAAHLYYARSAQRHLKIGIALRLAYAIPALALILLLAGLSIWFYRRSEKRHWAREQAIPELLKPFSMTAGSSVFHQFEFSLSVGQNPAALP